MIGVFDSGLGGLSVLASIARFLPTANLMYFADTAHVPYGEKTDAFIQARVLRIGEHLIAKGCKQIVVACNTATAAAIVGLRNRFPDIPVIGVEPGIKPAASATKSKRIAVLATPSTAKSKRLAKLIASHAKDITVDIIPCPGWATRVESLNILDQNFQKSVREQVEPIILAGADQIVLGCTHYSFLIPVLKPIAHDKANLVDVASAVARQTVRLASDSTQEHGKLFLQASAHPERLQAALPALGLQHLIPRLAGPAQLQPCHEVVNA